MLVLVAFEFWHFSLECPWGVTIGRLFLATVFLLHQVNPVRSRVDFLCHGETITKKWLKKSSFYGTTLPRDVFQRRWYNITAWGVNQCRFHLILSVESDVGWCYHPFRLKLVLLLYHSLHWELILIFCY